MAFATSGCSVWPYDLWPYNDGEYPYTTVDPISDFGHATQDLYAFITWITIYVFIGVSILLAVTLFRFKDDGSDRLPEQTHGNLQMEIGWTLGPIALVILMIVPTIQTIFKIADAPPAGAMDEAGQVIVDEAGAPVTPLVEIKVIGKRWWWAFEYVREGVVTANQFAIPDDRPVSLLITSDTVIHSFWVPRIGGKRDAVPGRVNRIWFNLDKDIAPGEVHQIRGQCAEYCGDAHALMRFEVVALDGADFDKWVAAYQAGPTFADAGVKAKGEEAFTAGGCIGCHAVTGFEAATGVQGPDLSFFADRRWLAAGVWDMFPNGRSDDSVARAKLTQWIRDPNSLKPGTTKHDEPSRALDGMNIPVDRSNDGVIQEDELSTAQVDAIVDYLLAQKSAYLLP